LLIWVKNKEAGNLTWNKVVFEYVQGGATQTKTFNDAVQCAWPGIMQGEGGAFMQEAVIRVDGLPMGLYQLNVQKVKGSVTRKVEVLRQ